MDVGSPERRDQPIAPQALPVPSFASSRNARAWVARCWLDPTGEVTTATDPTSVQLVAASVNESLPTTPPARLQLIRDIVSQFPANGRPTLYVFPGGFFGYDAATQRWGGLDSTSAAGIERDLIALCPDSCRIVVGVDPDDQPQQAWIVGRDGDAPWLRRVQRGQTSIDDRTIRVGDAKAAVFVCGEFTGSSTWANGPFNGRQLLSDPVQQLRGYSLLVDLAHRRIRMSLNPPPPPRLVHELQLRRFSSVGTGVLVHHHAGATVRGRAAWEHSSNCVILRGGARLPEADVTPVE